MTRREFVDGFLFSGPSISQRSGGGVEASYSPMEQGG